jgi:hypothetical protein
VWESQIPINKIINAKDAAKTMKFAVLHFTAMARSAPMRIIHYLK